jgi:dinuclear metal center YbgI/SA1388 family protein
MPTIHEIIHEIEAFAPLELQESWDNCGLLVGDTSVEAKGMLATIDVTEAVVDEAIAHGCNLIVAHHPLIFGGLKHITPKTDVERVVIKALKNDVAIYAAHTNMDVATHGVSWRMSQKLGLINPKPLVLQKSTLKKMVVFVPADYAEAVRNALFQAGAGHIGNYDSCSFNGNGTGTFRGNENTNPYVGTPGELHREEEVRIETVVPAHKQRAVVAALLQAHPYEEVAYDIYSLENKNPQIGLGVIAKTQSPVPFEDFLQFVKTTFRCSAIRHTAPVSSTVGTVALCGGAGSSFLSAAKAARADLFITGDFKYHQFFETENQIAIADIGHYESEQFTKELFYEIVTKKFSKFAVRLSAVETNPITYLF